MANKLDIVIFGATSFTGKYALIEAFKLFKNISWGIAGRDEIKLKRVLDETSLIAAEDSNKIPIILANIEEKDTIKNMTNQAKILINCCGPFDMCGGEVVVMSCLETGTHYIDVSAEELFIKNIISKFGKYAEEQGVYIVNLCGFDSVPYDLGVSFMENKFNGVLNSVEIYLNSRRDSSCPDGPSIHYTTWSSIVNTLSKYKDIKQLKKQFKEEKTIELKPKLTTKLPHRVKQGLAIPFPGTDEETVRSSQNYFYKNNNKRPVQVRNYIIMDPLYAIAITILLGLLCFILAQFNYGRKVLLKYPKFFSNGTFSHTAPTDEMLKKRHFSITFEGKGWSKESIDNNNKYKIQPNRKIVGCVSGTNPAYGFTGLAVVLCALMVLKEPHNIPPRGGVYTPAAIFSKTSLVEQLQNNGVTFEVISVSDLK